MRFGFQPNFSTANCMIFRALGGFAPWIPTSALPRDPLRSLQRTEILRHCLHDIGLIFMLDRFHESDTENALGCERFVQNFWSRVSRIRGRIFVHNDCLGRRVLLSPSGVPGVCPEGGWFWMKLTASLGTLSSPCIRSKIELLQVFTRHCDVGNSMWPLHLVLS